MHITDGNHYFVWMENDVVHIAEVDQYFVWRETDIVHIIGEKKII